MAFFSSADSSRAFSDAGRNAGVPAAHNAPARRGFFARLYGALLLSRQRTAERELARYLENNSKLTDRMERDIEQSVFAQSSSFDRFS